MSTYLYESSLDWLDEESNRPEELEEKMFDWVDSFQTVDVDVLYVSFGGAFCLKALERIYQVHKDVYKAIVTSACDVKASEPYLQYVIESKQIVTYKAMIFQTLKIIKTKINVS